jgi:hypothetical protein
MKHLLQNRHLHRSLLLTISGLFAAICAVGDADAASGAPESGSFLVQITRKTSEKCRLEMSVTLADGRLLLIGESGVLLTREIPAANAAVLFQTLRERFLPQRYQPEKDPTVIVNLNARIGQQSPTLFVSQKVLRRTPEVEQVVTFLSQIEEVARLERGRLTKMANGILGECNVEPDAGCTRDASGDQLPATKK